MPLYRATLEALINVTACSGSQAERNAREDAGEFIDQNEHDLSDIELASADDEETFSVQDLDMRASAECVDDQVDDDDDETERDWQVTVSFDVVFEAADRDAASAMAVGLPFRLDAMDKVTSLCVGDDVEDPEFDGIDRILLDPGISEFTLANLREGLPRRIEGAVLETEGPRPVVVLPPAPGMNAEPTPAPGA